ncbi:HesA/MoeB/ThiF family protein [Parahaliea mediterranea]|uniref:HesA/MoeB/ThiF family protein n=1 Tax=Parahaliea mediterranea TaxID=651086 RepID=UPI000E2E619B|nr:HesA/MoeB/ThiF family protein [Parahaliea mediterranea]
MSGESRYSRQLRLEEVGEQGQRRLGQARVLVVGLGGLGLPAAAYLAGAGIGHITLLDADVVALHNLHRQVFYRESDVGTPKVVAAARHLRALNTDITVTAQQEPLRDANAAALVAAHDVVVDAADSFAVTYLASDACLAGHTYLVSAAIVGNRGHLGVFCRDAPSYRALFPAVPAAAPDCSSHGVLGTAVGALGLMQAQEVIKLLLAPESALVGRLLTVDFWHQRYATLDFGQAEEPAAPLRIATLLPAELRPGDQLVDVRSADEMTAAPIAGALHLPDWENANALQALPTAPGRLVFVCASGRRARAAAQRLAAVRGGAAVAVLLRA